MLKKTLAATSVVLVCCAATPIASNPAAGATGPCGSLSGTPAYQHVVVIMDENVRYATLKNSSQAPYINALGARCGSEAFMHAATHSSQPNYMAVTSGRATGVAVHTSNDNIFHQAQVAGDSWASYEESMPRNCSSTTGFYKAGHNPAYWYTDLRSPVNTCALYDKPLSPALDTAIQNDALPTFTWITPNACNNMQTFQGCPQPTSQHIATGDAWLSRLIPRLTSMSSYQRGRTLIIITWDEGSGPQTAGVDCTRPAVYSTQPSCQIPTFIISPYVRPGAIDRTDHNLYGLSGDIADILGYPRLGRAVGQSSLRQGLGF